MAGLLEEVDTNVVSNKHVPTQNVIKSEARRKVRILSPPLSINNEWKKVIKKTRTPVPFHPLAMSRRLELITTTMGHFPEETVMTIFQ